MAIYYLYKYNIENKPIEDILEDTTTLMGNTSISNSVKIGTPLSYYKYKNLLGETKNLSNRFIDATKISNEYITSVPTSSINNIKVTLPFKYNNTSLKALRIGYLPRKVVFDSSNTGGNFDVNYSKSGTYTEADVFGGFNRTDIYYQIRREWDSSLNQHKYAIYTSTNWTGNGTLVKYITRDDFHNLPQYQDVPSVLGFVFGGGGSAGYNGQVNTPGRGGYGGGRGYCIVNFEALSNAYEASVVSIKIGAGGTSSTFNGNNTLIRVYGKQYLDYGVYLLLSEYVASGGANTDGYSGVKKNTFGYDYTYSSCVTGYNTFGGNGGAGELTSCSTLPAKDLNIFDTINVFFPELTPNSTDGGTSGYDDWDDAYGGGGGFCLGYAGSSEINNGTGGSGGIGGQAMSSGGNGGNGFVFIFY